MEDEIQMKGWQPEELAKAYELKGLKKLLRNYSVLQVVKPKLIDERQGLVSIAAIASNMLEEICRTIQMLHESGFVADMFDVRN